ncbi:hypothetical protein [Pseudomonas brassicacearum]|uniref:hypothetical protein n=1 Tax=Pseudomonas brassicacearum TaxID=930166 RepID=UPI0005763926|nr:hypothetical protein [Pseudomonas brassicacearum]ROM99446.1 hypothetical protein BK656_01550 [Pseudomonas brassicacearum]RON05842.1 hypothetical protein BK657_05540 [Pseudomonas brassicacearum]
MAWNAWDWKFVASTVIAIAALVVPQVDLSSRSLTVRLLSSSPLQPALNIQNLQISLNGQNVESPYVSTIELVNTGSKPITSADFDGVLQIKMANDAKLISAEITSTTPKNIPAQVATSGNKAAISPYLSNPKDAVTIAAITSGPRPTFEVHARIVGINEVGFEDTTVRKSSYWTSFVSLVTACGLLFLYFIFGPLAYRNKQVMIPRGLAFCTAAACALGGVKLVYLSIPSELFAGLPYAPAWAFAVALGSTLLIGLSAGKYLRRLVEASRV